MARITVEDCIDKFESRFELVLVASNRARKLHSGDAPTVEKDNDKNTVIALREIADETISIDDMKNSLIEEYQTVSPQTEEDLSIEYNEEENEEENNDSIIEDKNVSDLAFSEQNIDTSEQNIDTSEEINNDSNIEDFDNKDLNSTQKIEE